MTALKSLLYFLVVQNFGFYIPLAFLRTGARIHPGLLAYLALPLWAAGLMIVLWCFYEFTFRGRGTPLPLDPPRELVVSGLYRYVRNPIYAGVLLILLGHFLWLGTWGLLLYALSAFLLTHLFVILYEEPSLRSRFGTPYEDYLARVPRWIPRFKLPAPVSR
jgi:protein-S-isoprenylcysteine O-methyltransferase Ste14